jgi:hypothetical protein
MTTGRFVAYLRVSTQRQGASGLGLDAQKAAVRTLLEGKGWPLVAEFTEVESGRRNARPELARAMAACRLYGATLVIAELDRLSRNAAFLLALRDAGGEFVCCDMPDVNKLTIGILALVAEHEAGAISARTKAALAGGEGPGHEAGRLPRLRAKRRRPGQGPGGEPGDGAGTRGGAAAAGAGAAGGRGHELPQLAAELNARGVPAPRGGAWFPASGRQVLRHAPGWRPQAGARPSGRRPPGFQPRGQGGAHRGNGTAWRGAGRLGAGDPADARLAFGGLGPVAGEPERDDRRQALFGRDAVDLLGFELGEREAVLIGDHGVRSSDR